jgi:hypothetical protein
MERWSTRSARSSPGKQGRIVLYLERDGNYGTTNLYWRG